MKMMQEMQNGLLPLLVFMPMAGALVSFIAGTVNKRLRDLLFCLVVIAECVMAALLTAGIRLGQTYLWNWEGFAVFGLHLKADGFRGLYALIAAFMWMMTGLFSRQYFAHHHHRNRYYAFTLLTLGATCGVFLSDDLYTAFIFFEMMSFASYVWVAQEETTEALRAAETYLGIAVVGGMITLMGMFLLWHRLGSLDFEVLRTAGRKLAPRELYLTAMLLMTGFAAKAGVFPLHIWLPKAHPAAPAPASALLSGVLTKTGVFGMLVICSNLFSGDALWGTGVLLLGTVTMFAGALLAMFSINLKRTLACSSMSQIGFILIGTGTQCLLGEENALAVRGTIVHMVNHSLIKLCLFMAAGTVYMNIHRLDLNEIRGYGRGKGILHFAFLMGALGIGGIPLWNGYISKSLLHEGLLEYITLLESRGISAGLYRAVELIFVITGGMTVSYMLKLYIALFIEKQTAAGGEAASGTVRKGYLTGLSAFALLGSAILLPVFGMLPGIFMDGMAELGQGFLSGSSPAHAVQYFSVENLVAAAKSIAIGAVLYLTVIRGLLMEKREGVRVYVDRWPAWLDLENIFIRSRWMKEYVCGLAAAAAKVLDGLATSRLVYTIIPSLLTAVFRALDEWMDSAALLLCNTVLSAQKPRKLIPVGTRLTYYPGRLMDKIAGFLNHTVLRNHPVSADFEYRLDVDKREFADNIGMLTKSVSFGLLMTTAGLLITCWYLLR